MTTHSADAGVRVIIAGGRNMRPTDAEIEAAVHASGFTVGTVVSGTCRGVDQAGEDWALARGIPVKRFPPDWVRHGAGAGPIRNRAMAGAADGLIAFWDGESRGTANMIDEAKQRGLKVHIARPASDRS